MTQLKLIELRINEKDIKSKPDLLKSFAILEHTFESAHAFLSAFEKVKSSKQGTTKDVEQDLLRAMLVFASSGGDALLKQMLRDTIPTLSKKNLIVKTGLEKFVERQLKNEQSERGINHKFLAKILTGESRSETILLEYINDLTSESLQSFEELMKASNALGVQPSAITIPNDKLKKVFKERNKIIHELDINFEMPNRSRFGRSRSDMINLTNDILTAEKEIFVAVCDLY
ncbi:hypothetical protein [Leptospira koniambonensis]|uniref:hypothetical protein n=1 Tax=Leptospira koniambonensis TaxID=2484950 RepID=UPI003EB8A2F7